MMGINGLLKGLQLGIQEPRTARSPGAEISMPGKMAKIIQRVR